MPKVIKHLSYKKCGQCRKDRQKCLPQNREWPGRRCDRCLKYGYTCSASETKTQESTRQSQKGTVNAQDLPSSREVSLELVDRRRRSEARCLQDLGDIRQLIVCCFDLYPDLEVEFNMNQDLEEESDMDQENNFKAVVLKRLKKAFHEVLEETEVWAQQYETDGLYKDAAYLYSRIHSGLKEEPRIVPTLAAVYEKMGDYPAAELAQEKLMRIMQEDIDEDDRDGEMVPEVETFSRLLNLFHTRFQVLGSSSQQYAKLSIVYRAAVLDLEQLNVALFDQGLVGLDGLDQLKISSLHIAVNRNASNLARLLLLKGANPNLKNIVQSTPLHIAVENGTEKMVKLLLDWGADTEIKDIGDDTPIQKASLLERNNSILLLLIEKGADIETRDCEEHTPLGNAIKFDSPSTAQFLIKHGADVNATWNASNNEGTLLFEAVRQEEDWAVKLLLEKGANLQAVDDRRRQVLHCAIQAGQKSMVKVLLDHGGIQQVIADPVFKNTLLHFAVSKGDPAIIKIILKAGADTNKQNYQGDTPLHELIYHGPAHLAQTFRLLLKYGAQVNTMSIVGNTPLHLAVLYSRLEAVQMLLDAGADPHLVNLDGEAALDIAQGLCQMSSNVPAKEVLQMLNSHIAANPLGFSAGY